MLYAWGPIIFDVMPVNIVNVEEKVAPAYATHDVIGTAPIYERTGIGPHPFKLEGSIFPEKFGGLDGLEAMKVLARSGVPQFLLRGDGKPIGWAFANNVSEKDSHLNFAGVPRHIQFSADLILCDAPYASSLIDVIGGFLR